MEESRLRQLEAEAEAAKRLLSKEEPTEAGVVMLADTVLYLAQALREAEARLKRKEEQEAEMRRRLGWLRWSQGKKMGRGRW